MIALVEQQVDGLVHRLEPPRNVHQLRQLKEAAAVAQRLARPPEAPLDGVFREQQRVGDFTHAEATQRLQDQGQLQVDRQLRLTTREHHAQLVVADFALARGLPNVALALPLDELTQLGREVAKLVVTTDQIDGAVARHAQEPRRWVVGEAVGWPRLQRLA
ncbi:MAG: hypothetical protein QM756_40345 [Polyangiaceae bacterium]